MIAYLISIAVFGAPLAADAWEDHQLDVYLARLKATGEAVTENELPSDNVPVNRNASLGYKAAGLLIDPSRPAWDQWEKSRPGSFSLPLTSDERSTLRQIVADNGPALTEIASARHKQIGWWGDRLTPPYIGTGPGQVDLDAERRTGQLLKLAAISAHAEGDDRAAIRHLSDLCRLANSAEHRPKIFAHMVTGALWSLAVTSATSIVRDIKLGGGGSASREQLGELISLLLDERDANAGQRLAWQTERMIGVAEVRDAIAGRPTSMIPPQIGGSSLPRYLQGPLLLADARFACLYIEGVEQASSEPSLPSAGRLWPTWMDQEMDHYYGWHPIAGVLTAGGLGCVELHFQSAAERRLAAIAIGIRLFCVDHDGRRPAKLSELSPKYLPVEPADPMSGGAMIYQSGGSDPKVYSVGRNRVDNGGAEADPNKPWPRDRVHDDIVIHLTRRPRPVAPE